VRARNHCPPDLSLAPSGDVAVKRMRGSKRTTTRLRDAIISKHKTNRTGFLPIRSRSEAIEATAPKNNCGKTNTPIVRFIRQPPNNFVRYGDGLKG